MALISFAVTAKLILICVFVFAYADCWFSHEAAHIAPSLVTSHLMSISKNLNSLKSPLVEDFLRKLSLYIVLCLCRHSRQVCAVSAEIKDEYKMR